MSVAIIPYRVDIRKLRQAIGGGEKELADLVISRLADKVREHDGYLAELATPPISVGEVLSKWIEKGEFIGDLAHRYVALDLLCQHFGEMLDNEMFRDAHFEYFDVIDEGLRFVGLGNILWTARLTESGSPVDLGEPKGRTPQVGHMLRQEIAELLARGPFVVEDIPDAEAAVGVEQLLGWLEEALEHENDLICFWS